MAAALSRVYAGLCRRDRLTSKECPFWLDSLFCGYSEGMVCYKYVLLLYASCYSVIDFILNAVVCSIVISLIFV